MSRQRCKRTCAPEPPEIPSPTTQPVKPPLPHPILQRPFPSIYGAGTWFPGTSQWQSTAPPSTPSWLAGVQPPSIAGSSSKGLWQASAGMGASAPPVSSGFHELQAWGLNSHPPGGFLNLLKSTPQATNSGSASQAIDIDNEDHDDDCVRTEKRLIWTKEEDLRLVSAWLNNSNDPIQANYKKNDQYWKGVADVFNNTTPKNRVRSTKQIKDHFGRIKKRVAWFCGSWKEANVLWASGESDVELMDRAMKSYEEDHKKDGPFMFKHCWDVLRKEPKWDAYLERLEELEPDKRKFNTEEDVGQHFSLADARDERPMGGKKAKELNKRKRKAKSCIIDLEEDLHKFVDAQNKANEGRKEMLETQRRVSMENLEARKLAHLAAKEHKESVMLETYRSLLMQDTTEMPEDVRSEHVLAVKCLREKLFSRND